MSVVVDACVVRSASLSGKPLPSNCREVLKGLVDEGVQVVVSAELISEWRKHRSNYSATWIASMFSRKLVVRIDQYSQDALSAEAALDQLPVHHKEHAKKDSHILKLAIDAGKLIVSQEIRCKDAFKEASAFNGVIGRVAWVNPLLSSAPLVASGKAPVPRAWYLRVDAEQ